MIKLLDVPEIKSLTDLAYRISQASDGELSTIIDYAAIRDCGLLTAEQKDQIQEIINDEQDHQLILTEMMDTIVKKAFPDASADE